MVLFFGLVFPTTPSRKTFCRHLWQYVLEIQSDHSQSTERGASGGMYLGARALEVHQHFIQTFKKRVFQQKFRPKYA